jgi:protein TonB
MEAPRAPSLESAEVSHPLRDATETSPPVQERTIVVESVIMPTQPAVIDSSFPKEILMLTSPINATDSPGTKPIEQARLSGLPPVDNTLIGERSVQGKPGTKPDFGWLVQALLSRVQQLKRYPPVARMNHWEGKVEVRAVIREDGQLADVAVAKSSGHQELDDDALDVVKQASPLHLSHALGKPQVTVRLPISYRLEH